MKWKEIKTREHINDLMNLYGGFHDSCIVEIKYHSGGYVDEELRMQMAEENIAIFIFQRQYEDPRTIELKFEQVEKLNIVPVKEGYSTEIFGAAFFLDKDVFYWANLDCWDLLENHFDDVTWVGAPKVSYRIIN